MQLYLTKWGKERVEWQWLLIARATEVRRGRKSPFGVSAPSLAPRTHGLLGGYRRNFPPRRAIFLAGALCGPEAGRAPGGQSFGRIPESWGAGPAVRASETCRRRTPTSLHSRARNPPRRLHRWHITNGGNFNMCKKCWYTSEILPATLGNN